MGVLTGLKHQEVFDFFEEICQIPHGSYNVEQISDYLVSFAKDRNLDYIQDEWKNVIIIKEATKGYEKEPAIILQGHMDMVAVKDDDCEKDLKTEGLDIAIKDDYIYANKTSLGGDDGIFVAYALAVLDSDTLKHPKLEVIFTVDEEVGMSGAKNIDLSMLTGKRLINLDSEEEGKFWCSCAGGARVECYLDYKEDIVFGKKYELCVCGLEGGHSGTKIHEEHGNANLLLARAIYQLHNIAPLHVIRMQGGTADNAIPNQARAYIVVKNDQDGIAFGEELKKLEQIYKRELEGRDAAVKLTWEVCEEEKSYSGIGGNHLKEMLLYLMSVPNGVQGMSAFIHGLVETSLNLGIMDVKNGKLQCSFAVRSSVESKKMALIDKLSAVTVLAGGEAKVYANYPGWEYLSTSPFRDKMANVYEEKFGKRPEILAVHAGLECGFLAGKIEGLEGVSLGPDILDIHTTKEKLSISSTQRVWEYLIAVLQAKD